MFCTEDVVVSLRNVRDIPRKIHEEIWDDGLDDDADDEEGDEDDNQYWGSDGEFWARAANGNLD